MTIITTAKELSQVLTTPRNNHRNIGFVPTMGALHTGHISLLKESQKHNHITICSIFVNPTQFNNAQDFEKYPITIQADKAQLETANCDILFLPTIAEMYPEGVEKSKEKHYDIDGLDTILEGEFRPGHFQGVCNVVYRLLQMVQPNNLYMGIKDYQQCQVVQKLISKNQIPTQLHICPTLRDADGLAQSSRNLRLSTEARKKANTIYSCLQLLQKNKEKGNFTTDKQVCEKLLQENGFTPEYLLLANAQSLEVLTNYEKQKPMVVLIATWLDGVRLIDNMVL